jgi:hypothetical protein
VLGFDETPNGFVKLKALEFIAIIPFTRIVSVSHLNGPPGETLEYLALYRL